MVTRRKIIVSDRDAAFALSTNRNQNDALYLMATSSPNFFNYVAETISDCASAWCEDGSEAFSEAFYASHEALNYFLLALWSANKGSLPQIKPRDYREDEAKMGGLKYRYHELTSSFDSTGSYHFLIELTDKLDEVNEFTRCHLMLIMCIVLESIDLSQTSAEMPS